jgi:hypothetical protein
VPDPLGFDNFDTNTTGHDTPAAKTIVLNKEVSVSYSFD